LDNFKLRPYQIEAAKALDAHLRTNKIALLSAATGAGKTALVCRMIMRYYHDKPGRTFLVLAHKYDLLKQFYSTFERSTDIPTADIDYCCASIQKTTNFDCRIILASVQTIVNKLNIYGGADFVVVDETHRVSPTNESQYQKLLSILREYKPNHRMLGVTATVYRLGHGMIYGDRCRPGRTNFFPGLTHKISYKRLVAEGHLMPLKGKVAASDGVLAELNGVKLTGGEFTMGEAGCVMGHHVESAVEAYEQHAKHHKKVAVLACTIEHAEQLTEAFQDADYNAAAVHSKVSTNERNLILEEWQYGEVDIVVSVNVLVEGFDFPGLSCLIMCRPTKSPVIWVQAIGRILRTAPNKDEALLIDMTGNVREFGLDLDNPKFTIPQSAEGEGGEAPTKICPGTNKDGSACGAVVFAATLVCPDCGYEWDEKKVQATLGDMDDVDFEQLEPPQWYAVDDMLPSIHQSRNNGNKLLRIELFLRPDNPYARQERVSVWCCFEDYYDGYAIEKGKEKWELFSDEPYPASVEEAEWNFDSLNPPFQVLCSKDDKGYLTAVDFDFENQIVTNNTEVPF